MAVWLQAEVRTVAARYRVDEQISARASFYGDVEHPEAPWAPQPLQEFIEQDGTTGTMRVHQLLSLNVVDADADSDGS